MRAFGAAIVCLLLAPPAAFAHALVDVQSDLQQRESAVAFEPGVGSPFPTFSLQDPDGQAVDLASLRGKVVVLDVISMGAGDGPAQSELMAQIQREVAAGHMADQVELISVALDAEHDTVATRKNYGPAHDLKPENWVLLGGARDDDPEHLALQLAAKPIPRGLAPPVTYVVDSAGMLRARFFGLKFDPLNLVVYVNALANDHHEGAAPAASGPSLWQAVKGLL